MKLYIKDKKGKEKVINVKYWSFLKCVLLAQLVLGCMWYALSILLYA